jgi:hypothetical protein
VPGACVSKLSPSPIIRARSLFLAGGQWPVLRVAGPRVGRGHLPVLPTAGALGASVSVARHPSAVAGGTPGAWSVSHQFATAGVASRQLAVLLAPAPVARPYPPVR